MRHTTPAVEGARVCLPFRHNLFMRCEEFGCNDKAMWGVVCSEHVKFCVALFCDKHQNYARYATGGVGTTLMGSCVGHIAPSPTLVPDVNLSWFVLAEL